MSVKFRKGIDLVNQKGVNFADPTTATDAATKQYVDGVANGRDWKESVRAASTGNVVLASGLVNGTVIDGVTLATGDRVLLKNQTTALENGIYVTVASGAASRSTDADTAAEFNQGATTTAEEGTVNGDKRFVLTTNGPIVLGTTSLVFTVDAAGGGGYATIQENGSGLTQRTTLNFNAGLIATDNAGSTRTDVDIDTAVVVKKFAADCVATTNPQTFTHGLGTNDVQVTVWAASGSEKVFPDVTKGAGTVIVDWGAAPAAADYRVVIQG